MNFERPQAQGNGPKEPELSERIEELELRVHKLVGELHSTLERIPGGKELASTAEGQSKLLKIQESAQRFNQRVLGVMAIINAPTVFARIAEGIGKSMDADWAETLTPFINLGGGMTVTSLLVACLIISSRTMKMHTEAHQVLDTMEHK